MKALVGRAHDGIDQVNPEKVECPRSFCLSDPLKAKEVYDVPTWRKIQLLADLRNLCVHQKKTEPTDAQVEELIAGVSVIVKSVF
jgi:hypothetical protein